MQKGSIASLLCMDCGRTTATTTTTCYLALCPVHYQNQPEPSSCGLQLHLPALLLWQWTALLIATLIVMTTASSCMSHALVQAPKIWNLPRWHDAARTGSFASLADPATSARRLEILGTRTSLSSRRLECAWTAPVTAFRGAAYTAILAQGCRQIMKNPRIMRTNSETHEKNTRNNRRNSGKKEP